MLSYEDSKELQKLGYNQELKEGDWVYVDGTISASEVEPARVLRLIDSEWFCHPILKGVPYVKVPTTDGMIEGLNQDWATIENFTDEGEPVLVQVYGRNLIAGKIPLFGGSLKQALCELWKKVEGERNETAKKN